MPAYFSYFPTIEYPNAGIAKNITARVKLRLGNGEDKKEGLIDYQLPSGLRADVLAHQYYKDSTFDWLFYLANDVIDPYFDVYLTDDQLSDVVTRRYGSIDTAMQTVLYWKNNWKEDDSVLTSILYDGLTPEIKQLYDYVVDYNGNLTGYKRKQIDITKQTNMIITVTLHEAFANASADDVIIIEDDGGLEIGRAQLVSADDLTVVLQHVIDSYDGAVLRRRGTNDEATISSIDHVAISISETEAPYYDAVSAYDHVVERNEARKNVKLVGSDQADAIGRQLKSAMNG